MIGQNVTPFNKKGQYGIQTAVFQRNTATYDQLIKTPDCITLIETKER